MPQLSLALTLSDLLALKRQGVASVPRVELFRPGQHHSGDRAFTAADLTALVENFRALSAGPKPSFSVGIGLTDHDPSQPYLHAEGLPAAGRVTALWNEPGPVTCATFADLPESIAQAVEHGVYPHVSAEVLDDPPHGLPGSGCTLGAVVLLGTKRPGVKGMAPLAGVRRYAESRSPRGGVYVFAEITMASTAHKQALASLLSEKFPDVPPGLWETLSPQQVSIIDPGAGDGGDAGAADATAGGTADATKADDFGGDATASPAADVATMREELVTAAVLTQEEAAALSDDEIKAKYAEWKGTDAGGTATPPPPGVTTMSETVKPVQRPQRPTPPDVVRQFHEEIRTIKADLAAARSDAARQREESRRANRAEREKTVNAYFDRWVNNKDANGRPNPLVTPAEVESRTKSAEPGLYRRLIEADGTTVRTYSEAGSLSDFDALVKEIETRGGFARMFSERMPGRGVQPADPERAEVAKVTDDYIARRNKQITAAKG